MRGLLSDSARKSMEATWVRLSDPGSYQALQHFITEATWSAEAVWRRLREVTPACEGVLIIDGTGFPKQRKASVGVQRQYSGTLGKVGNCQVAVTAALWTGVRAWEQQYQELKTELRLDHFEGRSYPGWHRHVAPTAIACAFLQQERLRRSRSDLTLPKVKAVITEILTAHYLVTHPPYLDIMLKLKEIQLRN